MFQTEMRWKRKRQQHRTNKLAALRQQQEPPRVKYPMGELISSSHASDSTLSFGG
jgi:hypothetical protein